MILKLCLSERMNQSKKEKILIHRMFLFKEGKISSNKWLWKLFVNHFLYITNDYKYINKLRYINQDFIYEI